MTVTFGRSKAESGEYKAVFIDNVLIPYRSFLLLLGKQYPGVTFEEDIEPNLPPIWAEEVTVEEILFNFTENSFHATSRHNPLGQRKVRLHIYRKEDNILIKMIDNGYGIEPRVLKQLFLVPTTTKGSMEGTGLGLYRVRQIVDKLKGKAWAESEGKGKGATLVAELPIYKGDPNPPDKKSSQRVF